MVYARIPSIGGCLGESRHSCVAHPFDKGVGNALHEAYDRVQAWIDEVLAIDAYIGDREVDLRPGEIELSRPFGIASYSTTSKLRKPQYRLIALFGEANVR